MSLYNIKTGNRVEISFVLEDGRDIRYTSLVEENYEDGKLLLYIPMVYGKIIKLPVDEEYIFTFITEAGIIKCSAVIKEYVYINDFNFMIVQINSEIERIQRREFFRFDCVLPLKFILFSEDDSSDEENCFLEGSVKDISEGGIRFLSNEDIEVGEKIKFFITLNYECAIVKGVILHKQEYPKSNFKFQYRTQFFDLDAEEKDKILKYIFFEQRFKARMDRESIDTEDD